MKLIKLMILLLLVSGWVSTSEAQTSGGGPFSHSSNLNLTDGTTSGFPYKVNVSPGTLSCSGGVCTLTTGGGGGSPGGSVNDIQTNNGSNGFYGDNNFSYVPATGTVTLSADSTNTYLVLNNNDNFDFETGLVYQNGGSETWKLYMPAFYNNRLVLFSSGSIVNVMTFDPGTNSVETNQNMLDDGTNGFMGVQNKSPLSAVSVGANTSVSTIVSNQSLFGSNVYYDGGQTGGGDWRYIQDGRASAIRTNQDGDGNITFSISSSGVSGDIVDISTWNSDDVKMYIQSNGFIGMGLIPLAPLNVVRGLVTTPVTPVGDEVIIAQRAENASDNAIIALVSGDSGIAQLRFGDTTLTYNGDISYDNSAQEMRFQTGNTARLTIHQDGVIITGDSGHDASFYSNNSGKQFAFGDLNAINGLTQFILDDSDNSITAFAAGEIIFNSGPGISELGDVTNSYGNTNFRLDDSSQQITLNAANGVNISAGMHIFGTATLDYRDAWFFDAYGTLGRAIVTGDGTTIGSFNLELHKDTAGVGIIQAISAYDSGDHANPFVGINTQSPGNTLDVNGNIRDRGITASTPAIYSSAKDLASGSYSGNTTQIATVTGTKTSGSLIKYDASGNVTTAALIPGTLTDTKACTYTSSGTALNCNTTLTTGTVTSIGITPGTGVTVSGSPVTGSGNITVNSSAVEHLSYQPGLLTAVNATIGVYYKASKTTTVDNLIASAVTFSCVANPTITMYECGTSTTCAVTPVTIGTVTVTAAGTATVGTVSNPAVTAGDYIGWAMTAGTCASIDISATAQIHSN